MYLPPGPRVTGRRKDSMEKASDSTGQVSLPPGYDLPKEVREELPPQEDLWTNAPGELVWQYTADPEKEALGMTGFSWQVRKLTPGVHDQDPPKPGLQVPYYQASTPYRLVFYQAETPEMALAALLKGVCILSRDGAMNPHNPNRAGSPPIQHAITILTERLMQVVESRHDHLFMSGYAENPAHVGAIPIGNSADDETDPRAQALTAEIMNEQMMRAIARDNEVISALATAVAALARVKDL